MRLLAGIALSCSALLLAGCNAEKEEPQLPPDAVPVLSPFHQNSQIPNTFEILSVIDEHLENLPDNPERLNIYSSGSFNVTEESKFCVLNGVIDWRVAPKDRTGLSIPGERISAALEKRGQPIHIDNQPRHRLFDAERCSGTSENILYQGQIIPNRVKKSYKIVLAAWQGDPETGGALWLGEIERLEGRRPGVKDNPPFSGPKFWKRQSIKLDWSGLYSRLIKDIIGS